MFQTQMKWYCYGIIGGTIRLICKLKWVECCRQSWYDVTFDQFFKALHHNGSEGYQAIVIECWYRWLWQWSDRSMKVKWFGLEKCYRCPWGHPSVGPRIPLVPWYIIWTYSFPWINPTQGPSDVSWVETEYCIIWAEGEFHFHRVVLFLKPAEVSIECIKEVRVVIAECLGGLVIDSVSINIQNKWEPITVNHCQAWFVSPKTKSFELMVFIHQYSSCNIYYITKIKYNF